MLFVYGKICSAYVEFHGRGLRHDVHDLLVHRLLRLVEVLDELADPALVLERLLAALAALVGERDDEAGVEERELAKTAREDVVAVLRDREDLRIRLEGDLGAGLVRLTDDGDRRGRSAPSVLLEVDLAGALDLELEPFAHRVDRAHADAVETGGDLVARVVELPARVEDGHHDFGHVDVATELLRLLLVPSDRDASAVVLDRDRAVEVDRHVHAGAVAGQMLVDRVVDDLPNEMMQTGPVVDVADVHAGALTNRLETFEDGDALAAVVGRGRRLGRDGSRRGALASIARDFVGRHGSLKRFPSPADGAFSVCSADKIRV